MLGEMRPSVMMNRNDQAAGNACAVSIASLVSMVGWNGPARLRGTGEQHDDAHGKAACRTALAAPQRVVIRSSQIGSCGAGINVGDAES